MGIEVACVQNRVALLVNHLALVVGYVVVLQQLLAHVKVARLHLALGAFDAAGHDAGFNRFALGHFEPVHDGLDAVASKNPHQRIVQAQIKARRAGVALTARAATQLVVNAARLVALSGNNAQAAQRGNGIVVQLPLGLDLGYFGALGAVIQAFIGLHFLQGFFDIAA